MRRMITVAGLVLAAHAVAGEGPVLRDEARRRYPARIYDDRSVDRQCTVDATLDDRGHVSDTVVVDCPPELAAFAQRIVRHDRWRKPVLAGTVVRVEAVFKSPIDVFQFPHPDTWRYREGPVCDVHLAIGEDGQVRVRSATEGCAPLAEETTRVPPAPWAGQVAKLPILCPVTFRTEGEQKKDIELFRCPPATWAHAGAVMDALDWPDIDRVWAVVLGFGGEAAR